MHGGAGSKANQWGPRPPRETPPAQSAGGGSRSSSGRSCESENEGERLFPKGSWGIGTVPASESTASPLPSKTRQQSCDPSREQRSSSRKRDLREGRIQSLQGCSISELSGSE